MTLDEVTSSTAQAREPPGSKETLLAGGHQRADFVAFLRPAA
jgi:hypothetical protein